MKLILFFAIIFSSVIFKSYSQETLLYNESGQLKCDSSFQVDVELLDVIGKIEKCLLQVYKAVQYPEIAYENGIEGLIIIKLNIDNKNLSICSEIAKRLDPAIDKAVLDAISKSKLAILRNTVGTENFSFFLPFQFESETIPFLDDLKNHGLIRIRRQELVPTYVPL